mmetsp:Transcript_24003/g.70407  ORF Transcript_24003/g.70407 Transcript_24003/m.70407 type:complete len:207 (-) Transcript_24003:1240-1860(-)
MPRGGVGVGGGADAGRGRLSPQTPGRGAGAAYLGVLVGPSSLGQGGTARPPSPDTEPFEAAVGGSGCRDSSWAVRQGETIASQAQARRRCPVRGHGAHARGPRQGAQAGQDIRCWPSSWLQRGAYAGQDFRCWTGSRFQRSALEEAGTADCAAQRERHRRDPRERSNRCRGPASCLLETGVSKRCGEPIRDDQSDGSSRCSPRWEI